MKLHRHTWKRDGRLCDYRGCYEESPQSWHDSPIWLKAIVYLIIWFVASVVGLIIAYFMGLKGYLIGLSAILILACFSRYYGITKN